MTLSIDDEQQLGDVPTGPKKNSCDTLSLTSNKIGCFVSQDELMLYVDLSDHALNFACPGAFSDLGPESPDDYQCLELPNDYPINLNEGCLHGLLPDVSPMPLPPQGVDVSLSLHWRKEPMDNERLTNMLA